MEAARLKLGLGMDTLSALRHSSSPPLSSAKLRPAMVGVSSSAAANPRLLNLDRWSRLRSSSTPAASASASSTTPPKQKERDLVFVAGATGRVGSRAVRELIKLGFRVRAAVRDAQRASSLVQSVKKLKLDNPNGNSPAEKLEIIECDLEKQPEDGIVSAIGNAALVVCSIGASEKEIFDVTGPYRIDYMATNKLIQAATAAKVEHFILVTSLGTNKIGFPAFLLNLFWGVLFWKRRAEEALIASGIPYTVIRPGGMERPTDVFKETHNLVVAAEDTYVGGLVSNLQVAELIGFMAKNRKAAYCKVVEVIAETTAPLLPMDQLLCAIPSKREPPAEEEEVVADSTIKLKSDPKTTTGGEATKTEQPLSPYTGLSSSAASPSSSSPRGGVATPADAALMMQLGCDGVFVGSGIFKSHRPGRHALLRPGDPGRRQLRPRGGGGHGRNQPRRPQGGALRGTLRVEERTLLRHPSSSISDIHRHHLRHPSSSISDIHRHHLRHPSSFVRAKQQKKTQNNFFSLFAWNVMLMSVLCWEQNGSLKLLCILHQRMASESLAVTGYYHRSKLNYSAGTGTNNSLVQDNWNHIASQPTKRDDAGSQLPC